MIVAQDDFEKNIKNNPLLKQATKNAAESGIRELADTYQQAQARFQEEMMRKQGELLEPIVNKVKAAADVIRLQDGMSMVLDKSSGIVVSHEAGLDITDRVLEELIKMETADSSN